jgi:hypothetical protein
MRQCIEEGRFVMSEKISRHDKFRFFVEALKGHLLLYGLGILLMLAFFAIGYMAFWGGSEPRSFAGTFFFVDGIAVFVLILYLNVTGMQDDYASAMLRKYGRNTTARVTKVSFEADDADSIIRCYVSVNYTGQQLTELIELPGDKAHLLDTLQQGMHVPVRVVDGVPATLRIAPRELLNGLENAETRFRHTPAQSNKTTHHKPRQSATGFAEQSPRQKHTPLSPTPEGNP